MLEVEKYETDRYYVSIRRGNVYLCDVQEFGGNGWCGCRDFQYRHLPELSREQECGKRHTVQRRCKHLIALMDWLNPTVAQSQNVKEDEEAAQQGDRRQDEQEANSSRDMPLVYSHGLGGLSQADIRDIAGYSIDAETGEIIDPEEA